MDLDFDKMNGLVPAIIQDNDTRKVLMLGFMNKEAYEKTVETGKVTFFSRTKNRLWTKGEESGNFLNVVSIKEDCDKDTLLIQVNPGRPGMPYRHRYLLGREERRAGHVPQTVAGLHRQTSRRDAREVVYHQLVSVRHQQDSAESRRRGGGNSDRGYQRYR